MDPRLSSPSLDLVGFGIVTINNAKMAIDMVTRSIRMIPDNFNTPTKAAAITGAQIPEPHSAKEIMALERVNWSLGIMTEMADEYAGH